MQQEPSTAPDVYILDVYRLDDAEISVDLSDGTTVTLDIKQIREHGTLVIEASN